MRRPGSEDPQRHEQNICFIIIILKFTLSVLNIYFLVILINQLISDEIEMSVGLFPFDVQSMKGKSKIQIQAWAELCQAHA